MEIAMPHQIVPLPFKPPRLDGLSERLLASHYENNYGGAVRRLNAIEARLQDLDWATAPVFEINGLKREELVAANSMILHEAYFDGLGGSGDAGGELAAALERDFGSVAGWRSAFASCAKAQAGGSGWTLLTWSERHGRLVIQWAADHTHCLAGGVPILALDMHEHAYHLDFGAKAGAYVDAFMKNMHWQRVAARFGRVRRLQADAPAGPGDGDALSVAPEDLRTRLEQGEDVVLLDVCLAEDLAKRSDMLPGRRSERRSGSPNGPKTCRGTGRLSPIASTASRSVAMPSPSCAAAASTPATSPAASPPGMRSAGRRFR
jgi:Fe-Mn family superoxide dismutase